MTMVTGTTAEQQFGRMQVEIISPHFSSSRTGWVSQVDILVEGLISDDEGNDIATYNTKYSCLGQEM